MKDAVIKPCSHCQSSNISAMHEDVDGKSTALIECKRCGFQLGFYSPRPGCASNLYAYTLDIWNRRS